jgi:hypothetical protein
MTITRPVKRSTWLCMVLAILAGASSAAAGHDPYRIKSLKGDAYRGPDSLRVTVRYDVRMKDYDPQVEYELILYLTEEGRPLQDQEGQPLQQVVRLRQPKINKKGEARFVGQAEGDIALGLMQNAKHLRVQAALYYVGDSRPLATKQTGLKVHKD